MNQRSDITSTAIRQQVQCLKDKGSEVSTGVHYACLVVCLTDDTTNAAHIPKRTAQHKHVEMYTVNMYTHAAGAHILWAHCVHHCDLCINILFNIHQTNIPTVSPRSAFIS